MRARTLFQIVSFAVIVAVGVMWIHSRSTAIDLQRRLSALTELRRNTARTLEQERDRLRATLKEANRLRAAEVAATSPAPIPPAAPRVIGSSLALGEWRSPGQWRNEGQSTARSTVATLLWAAGGGDVAAMMPLIAYDEAGRKEAQALFDSLPPSARQAFPTPEALVAGLTIQAVPNSAVQLSWYHERDDDRATVGLLLSARESTAPEEVSAKDNPDTNPPMPVDPRTNQLAVLSLQRSPVGWRIVVPAAAIKRLARLYRAPTN